LWRKKYKKEVIKVKKKDETKQQDFTDIPVSTLDPRVDILKGGKTLIKTEVEYHTAISVQKPRDIDEIVKNVLKEAEFGGQEFYYSWPINTKYGKKIVEGGSVGLAVSLAREWTNCAIPVEVSENDECYTFRAAFVDLEKGFTLMRTYRQRKAQDIGKKYDEQRAQDMIFQIGQSKAIRNVVLNAVPKWLVKQAIERAKEAVLKNITKDGIDTARNKAISFFQGYGISVERLIIFLGKKENDWTIEDITQLRSAGQMVKDGEVSTDEIFPPLETEEPKKPQTTEEVLGNGKNEDTKEKGKSKPKQKHTKEFIAEFVNVTIECVAKGKKISPAELPTKDKENLKKVTLKKLERLPNDKAEIELNDMKEALK